MDHTWLSFPLLGLLALWQPPECLHTVHSGVHQGLSYQMFCWTHTVSVWLQSIGLLSQVLQEAKTLSSPRKKHPNVFLHHSK